VTSQEITAHVERWHLINQAGANPQWEIAYQLAVMNERNASGDEEGIQRMLKKVGLGSPVNTESHPEVRGSDSPSSDTSQTKPPGIEGFEPPVDPSVNIHTYRRGRPDNRFCCKCGAGEFHAIHDVPVCSNCAGIPTGPDPRMCCAVCKRPLETPPSDVERANRKIARACHQVQHDCAFCGRSMSDHRLPGDPEPEQHP
jgi:hypothetical protein